APGLREVGGRIETADGNVGKGAEARVAVLVEVGAGRGADGLLGRLLESGGQGLLRPLFFGVGGVTSFENVCDRTLGDLRLGIRFLVIGHAAAASSVR